MSAMKGLTIVLKTAQILSDHMLVVVTVAMYLTVMASHAVVS